MQYTLKCSICGGELEINQEMTIGQCQYCNSKNIIPRSFARRGNLFNRAVFLRQNNEFDRAMEAYEEILKEDNTDAEAHWGLSISKYGIEYVKDPDTNEYIPTCHRVQTDTILNDIDYLAAIEYADDNSIEMYKEEAQKINDIQRKIIAASSEEPPYDIFICYKETDTSGNRTEDSVIAQELYYLLTDEGYKVFFARKTLEEKLGKEYEPIIFAGINTAKIMIVLGTKPEYFNAVWVKNEWSRFRELTKKDRSKTIIPVFKNMPSYDLPNELAMLQAQDMSKLGFAQDLCDGIDKIINKTSIPNDSIEDSNGNSNPDRLVKNANTILKLNMYDDAYQLFEKITIEYPEDYRGWWGLIISKTVNFTLIADEEKIFAWFNCVRQMANENLDSLEQEFKLYLRKLTDAEIPEEKKRVQARTEEFKDINKAIDYRINNYVKQNNKLVGEKRPTLERMDNDINYYQHLINEIKGLRKKKKQLIFSLLAILLSAMLMFNSYNTMKISSIEASYYGFPAILLFVLGLGFLLHDIKTKSKRENQKTIDIYLHNIEKSNDAKRVFVAKYESNLTRIKKFKEELSKPQSIVNDLIDKCNLYLQIEDSKISYYLYLQKCKTYNIREDGISEIEEQRKEIFDFDIESFQKSY